MNEKEAMKKIIQIIRVIAEAKARFESKDDRITMDDLKKYAEGFGQSLDDLQEVISCVLDRPAEAPAEDKTEQFANVGKKILEELKKLRTKEVVESRVVFRENSEEFCVSGYGDDAQITHRFSGMLQFWDVRSVEIDPPKYMKLPGCVREEYENRIGSANYAKIDNIIKSARRAGRI